MQDLQQEILSEQNIIVHSYENVTITDIPAFLRKIDEITSQCDDSIIQLLDADLICGRKHLNQGITQAIKAFSEKQNFAKDRGLEICVRLSTQKQISQALKLLGIKEEGNITVIYIDVSEKQVIATEKLLGKRNDMLIEEYDERLICEKYELSSSTGIVEQINEKIALLALKN